MELQARWHCRLISSYPASSRALLVSTGLSVSTTDIWSNPDPRSRQKSLRRLLLFYYWELFTEKPRLGNALLGFSQGERLTNAIRQAVWFRI
jgi:hypothetical protein